LSHSRLFPWQVLRRVAFLWLVLTLGMSSLYAPAGLARQHTTVTVTLPSDPVWLQGVLLNQINNRYPLIEHGNTLYFPLTWNLSRFMGIETAWSEADGLSIVHSARFAPLDPPDDYFNDLLATYRATIKRQPITLNGRIIMPPSVGLPWLIFRGVTYLPLTAAMIEELRWQVHMYPERGIDIEAGNVATSELETVITLLNNTAHSRRLGFTAHLTMPQSEDSMIITGQIENSTTPPFGALRGNYWWQRLTFDYAWQIILGAHRTSGITYFSWRGDMSTGRLDTAVGTDAPMRLLALQIQQHPLFNLTDFAILGQDRYDIARLEPLAPTRPSTSRYVISFHSSAERFAFRTIEVTVDWTTNRLREVIIRDRIFDPTDEFYGSGWYTLRLILHNRR